MDMSQYRELFLSETREHLRTFNELIVALEGDADDRDKIDSLFRMAHSIKGMAASMEYGEIAELAHKIEDLMDKVRKKLLTFEPAMADLLLEGADLLEGLVDDVATGAAGGRDFGDFLQRLVNYAPAQRNGAVAPPPATGRGEDGREKPPGEKPKELTDSPQSVRVRTAILDNLINTTGELFTNKHRLMNVARGIGSAPLGAALEELSRLLRELHNEVLNVRMVPFASITDRLPRVVRDLARKSGKDVALEIEGKEIELDRGIVEELADPLIHILRNAVDHGVETAAERLDGGKAAQGRITLSAVREKDHICVTVADDGRGMDPAKLTASALARGIITPEEARLLTPRDALFLTCHPGFSTAERITDVSGRGVGMDAARTTIQSLGGTLAIESEAGRGTRIIIRLPLTIAIIDVLLVGCGDLTCAVPVTAIQRTLEIRRDAITTHGRRKVFYLDDEPIQLLSMARIFRMPAPPPAGKFIPLFVSEVKGRRVALVVDRLLGHQEVFVKPLGRPLGRMKGLSGGAILGNGEVVSILDVANIL
ncbi:MAG TPA: chemotaxis protein CheA [Geobacteraceae bacterium]